MATDIIRLFGTGPVLPVHDIPTTVTFYCDQLGFELDFIMGEPPEHGSVTRDSIGIQFTNAPGAFDAATYPGWTYIFVDNIHALYNEYERQEVVFTQPLGSREHGMTEFELEDLNGFRLRFGQYQ